MQNIDGSTGNGGGQILRTALAYAGMAVEPIRVRNIRVDRNPPGLSAQHLAVVRTIAELCRADVEGDTLRSTSITFMPEQVPDPGTYEVDVADYIDGNSAGSVTLLFQALLWPLLVSGGPCELRLHGGTHVKWSPPVEYLSDVYLPSLRELGVHATVECERCGFYPEGRGVLYGQIHGESNTQFSSIERQERGDLYTVDACSAVANLPDHIRRRQAQQTRVVLENQGIPVRMETTSPPSSGPGTYVYIHASYEHSHAGFVSYGHPGKPAEKVGREAAEAFLRYHESGAPVQSQLADQLLLPLSLAEGPSVFRVSEVTDHVRTIAEVVRKLSGTRIRIQDGENGSTVHIQ